MAAHKDLIDAFVNAAKGRGIDHVAGRVAHEHFLGRHQFDGFNRLADIGVLGVRVPIPAMFRIMTTHPRIVLERGLAGDDFAADGVFAIVEITQNHDGVAGLDFFDDQLAQHPCLGHAAGRGA